MKTRVSLAICVFWFGSTVFADIFYKPAREAQGRGGKGDVKRDAVNDGLRIPGSAPALLADSRLTLQGTVRLDDPQRPLQLTANHRLFALDAKALTAGHRSGDLNLHLPDLEPFGPLAGAKLRGDAQLAAHVDYTPALTKLTTHLSTHLDGGEAAWSGLVRGGLDPGSAPDRIQFGRQKRSPDRNRMASRSTA